MSDRSALFVAITQLGVLPFRQRGDLHIVERSHLNKRRLRVAIPDARQLPPRLYSGVVRRRGFDRYRMARRTRNGFTPRSRLELAKRCKGLETTMCPFANLPEASGGRWGAGLTLKKMADCRRLKPTLVGQFEFMEWTPDNHLRHSRFMGLREDKKPKDAVRER